MLEQKRSHFIDDEPVPVVPAAGATAAPRSHFLDDPAPAADPQFANVQAGGSSAERVPAPMVQPANPYSTFGLGIGLAERVRELWNQPSRVMDPVVAPETVSSAIQGAEDIRAKLPITGMLPGLIHQVAQPGTKEAIGEAVSSMTSGPMLATLPVMEAAAGTKIAPLLFGGLTAMQAKDASDAHAQLQVATKEAAYAKASGNASALKLAQAKMSYFATKRNIAMGGAALTSLPVGKALGTPKVSEGTMQAGMGQLGSEIAGAETSAARAAGARPGFNEAAVEPPKPVVEMKPQFEQEQANFAKQQRTANYTSPTDQPNTEGSIYEWQNGKLVEVPEKPQGGQAKAAGAGPASSLAGEEAVAPRSHFVEEQPQSHFVEEAASETPKEQSLAEAADEYNAARGYKPIDKAASTIDETKSKAIADFYMKAKSEPENPEVKAAYEKLNNEVEDQYKFLVDKGYKMIPSEDALTYSDLGEMNEDVAKKQLKVWTGEPPAHGLMNVEQNMKFRFVHDLMGHAVPQATAGHAGEELAYNIHKQMFSPEARAALATETRGQNAAVHFGMDNPPETIYRPEFAGTPETQLKFPEQKAVRMPEVFQSKSTEDPVAMFEKAGYKTVEPKTLRISGKQQSFFLSDDGKIVRVGDHYPALLESGIAPLEDVHYTDAIKTALKNHGMIRGVVQQGEVSLQIEGPVSRNAFSALARIDEANPTAKWVYDIDINGRKVSKGNKDFGTFMMDLETAEKGKRSDPFASKAEPGREAETAVAPVHAEVRNTARGVTMYVSKPAIDEVDRIFGKKNSNGVTIPGPLVRKLGVDSDTIQDPAIRQQLQKAVIDANQLTKNGPIKIVRRDMPGMEVKRIARHERAHEQSMQGDIDLARRAISNRIRSTQLYQKVVANLTRNGYKDLQGSSIEQQEVVAHLAAGELRRMGITSDEAYELFGMVYDAYADVHGPLAAEKVFEQSHPRYKGQLDAKRRKFESSDFFTDREVSGSRGEEGGVREVPADEATPADRNRAGSDELRESGPGGPADGAVAEPTASRGAERHLTESERARTKPRELAKVQDIFEQLPHHRDIAELAKAGAVGRYWYENSAKALRNYFGEDTPQFTKLLAATSPQTNVRANLRGAIDAWQKWEAAGRPTDETSLKAILESSPLTKEAFAGRHNNAFRVLTNAETELSGPKVSSFFQNLTNEAEFVTNDVWMGRLASLGPRLLGTKTGYLALSARIRAAAKLLGWKPQQVQAASWSFIKPLHDIMMKGVPAREALKHVRPETAKDIWDFAKLFQEDPDVRAKLDEVLKSRGHSLESLESTFAKADKPVYPGEEATAPRLSRGFQKQLEAGVERLRSERAAKADARRKAKDEETGQLGISQSKEETPREKRPGEAGVFAPFKKAKPRLDLGAKYNEIQKEQDASLQPKKTPLLDQLSDAHEKTVEKYMDWAVKSKHYGQEARKRGVDVNISKDPYEMVKRKYGGAGGVMRAAAIEVARPYRKALAAGLEDEYNAYLNLNGYLREYRILRIKEADFRAQKTSAGTRQANEIQAKMARGEVVPKYQSENEIRADLGTLRNNLGPKWNDVEGWAKEKYKVFARILDQIRGKTISDETYNKIKSYGPDYTALHRIFDDIDAARGSVSGGGMTLREQHGVRSMRGSERTNLHPVQADINAAVTLLRDLEKSETTRAFVNFKNTDPNGFGQLISQHFPGQHVPKDEGLVHFYEDGKQQAWAVPSDVAEVLKLADRRMVEILGESVLGLGRRVNQMSMITLSLPFHMRNVFRDVADTRANVGHRFGDPIAAGKFLNDLRKAMAHRIAEDDVFLDSLRTNAVGGTLQQMLSPETFMKVPQRGLLEKVLHPIDSLSNLLDIWETSMKMAGYENLVSRGVPDAEAASLTREFVGTPDAINAGTMSPTLATVFLFPSARLKGWERNLKMTGLKGMTPGRFKSSRSAWAKRGLAALFAYAVYDMAMLMNNASYPSADHPDDGTMEWDHVSDNDKQNYDVWLLPQTYETSEGTRRHIGLKMPLGYVRQMVGTPVRSLMEHVLAEVPNFQQEVLDIVGSLIPGQMRLEADHVAGSLARGGVGMLAPALQEPIEQATVDTYSGRPVVSEALSQREPKYQYDARTTILARKIGEIANVSPKRIDHALQGLGGGVEVPLSVAERFARGSEEGKMYPFEGPEKWTKWPFIGPFIRSFVVSSFDQSKARHERKFYDQLDEAEAYNDTIGSVAEESGGLAKVANEYLNDPRKLSLALLAPELRKAANYLKDASDALRDTLENKNVSDDKKKQAARLIRSEVDKKLKLADLNESYIEAVKNLTPDQRQRIMAAIIDRKKNLNLPEEEKDNEQ